MPQIGYPLIEFGSGVFLTGNGLVGGERYIATVDGLDQLALTDDIGITRALNKAVYTQYQTANVDVEVTVNIPRLDWAKFDAIRDVINTAIAGATTYALNVTVNGEAFTFTAKPGGISYEPSDVADYVESVKITQFVTD